jgi:Arc/MetJ-type ribon-helix-helix transcriptional regulator
MKKILFAQLQEPDYEKLNQIVSSGKYASKVDFLRTKIREEKIEDAKTD